MRYAFTTAHRPVSEALLSEQLMLLADEIVRSHDAAIVASCSALQHARRAGELLLEAKGKLRHGQWLPWLAQQCPTIAERTAQAYMRIAQRWPELEAKAQRVADLPVRRAVALLAESRPGPGCNFCNARAKLAAWFDMPEVQTVSPSEMQVFANAVIAACDRRLSELA